MGLGAPLDRQEGWGDAGNWKALSAVFSRQSPDVMRVAYSLPYAELAEAEEGAAEIQRRFKPQEFHLFREELICMNSALPGSSKCSVPPEERWWKLPARLERAWTPAALVTRRTASLSGAPLVL